MPTQSESAAGGEWAARTRTPKRSVFGNYRAAQAGNQPAAAEPNRIVSAPAAAGDAPALASADTALGRAFIHRFLAQAYADPAPETWRWLADTSTLAALRSVAGLLSGSLATDADALASFLRPDTLADFVDARLSAFGHAARGACPLNEIEYGDLKADPLFQPHRLADLAAFYRAFGLEIADDAGERQDHLCLELEFMCVLAAKEAYALANTLAAGELELCRDAQQKFLREHLGRWTPAFTRRLTAATDNPALQALSEFTRAFVETECRRFGVPPGSEDLLLRPADEAAGRQCDACGIASLPPGALATT